MSAVDRHVRLDSRTEPWTPLGTGRNWCRSDSAVRVGEMPHVAGVVRHLVAARTVGPAGVETAGAFGLLGVDGEGASRQLLKQHIDAVVDDRSRPDAPVPV